MRNLGYLPGGPCERVFTRAGVVNGILESRKMAQGQQMDYGEIPDFQNDPPVEVGGQWYFRGGNASRWPTRQGYNAWRARRHPGILQSEVSRLSSAVTTTKSFGRGLTIKNPCHSNQSYRIGDSCELSSIELPDPNFDYILDPRVEPNDTTNIRGFHRKNVRCCFYLNPCEPIQNYAPIDVKIIIHGEVWEPPVVHFNQIFNSSYYFRRRLQLALLDKQYKLDFEFTKGSLEHPNYFAVLSGQLSWQSLYAADQKDLRKPNNHSECWETRYTFSLIDFLGFCQCFGFTERYIINLFDPEAPMKVETVAAAVYYCETILQWHKMAQHLANVCLDVTYTYVHQVCHSFAKSIACAKLVSASRTERAMLHKLRRDDHDAVLETTHFNRTIVGTRFISDITYGNDGHTHQRYYQSSMTLRHWLKIYSIPERPVHPCFLKVIKDHVFFAETDKIIPVYSEPYSIDNRELRKVYRSACAYPPILKEHPNFGSFRRSVETYLSHITREERADFHYQLRRAREQRRITDSRLNNFNPSPEVMSLSEQLQTFSIEQVVEDKKRDDECGCNSEVCTYPYPSDWDTELYGKVAHPHPTARLPNTKLLRKSTFGRVRESEDPQRSKYLNDRLQDMAVLDVSQYRLRPK